MEQIGKQLLMVEIEDRTLELTCLTLGKVDWKPAIIFHRSIHL